MPIDHDYSESPRRGPEPTPPSCWSAPTLAGGGLCCSTLGHPGREFVANTIAKSVRYEGRLIGQRTRGGLAAKRAAGVRLGRPSVLGREVVERIVRERAAGRSLRVIAEGLAADGVPTARGGASWSTSSVQAVLAGQDAATLPVTA